MKIKRWSLKRWSLNRGLKQYILLLTLLPTLLITLVLTTYLVLTRQTDAQDELIRHGTSSVIYLSKVSDLDFFSGDKVALTRLAEAAIAEANVKSVTFYDFKQAKILTVGAPSIDHSHHFVTTLFKEEYRSQWIFQMPVIESQIEVSDFSEVNDNDVMPAKILGWVQIIADKSYLLERQRSILLAGATIGLLGFSLLAFLALKFSQSITLPLDGVTTTVKQLESGDLSARVNVKAKGELNELTRGINRLAEKVEVSNQSLKQRVQLATAKLTQTLNVLEQRNHELEEAGKELAGANKSKDEFLARVSHELRTPLTSILGYVRLLKKAKLPGEQSGQAAIIHQASTLLLSLIDNILDFSKFESQSIELESRPFNLETVLEEALDLHRYVAREKGLDLRLTIEPDVPLDLLGDELRIKQIVTNLLCNAVKFTQQGQVLVKVSLLKNEQDFGIQFTIQDTGIGISEKQMAKIFQPFYQADPSISRRFGGTGLGLVISEKLVQLLGGEIKLSSKKDEGTKVDFTIFKIKRQHAEDEKRLKDPVKAPLLSTNRKQLEYSHLEHTNEMPLSKVRILLAEDNPYNKKLLERVLNESGATVITAEDGKTALEKCRTDSIDLVIMDYHMPVMDGLKACEMIRKSFSSNELPILLLTADINISKRDLQLKGINQVIHKPVDEADLLQSVITLAVNPALFPNEALLHTKVLDFVPDEVILREINRLVDSLQQAYTNRQFDEMKKRAHELCGVAGPTTKFRSFEILGRELEREIDQQDLEKISLLLKRLAAG